MGYFFAIVTAIVTIVGNVTAKLWADKPRASLLLITLFFYSLSSVAFPLALRYGKLTILNAFSTVVVFLITSLFSLWFFKEKLTTLQFVGLVLGFVAILLLSFEGQKLTHPM